MNLSNDHQPNPDKRTCYDMRKGHRPKKDEIVGYVINGIFYNDKKVQHCDPEAEMYQVEFLPSSSVWLQPCQIYKFGTHPAIYGNGRGEYKFIT